MKKKIVYILLIIIAIVIFLLIETKRAKNSYSEIKFPNKVQLNLIISDIIYTYYDDLNCMDDLAKLPGYKNKFDKIYKKRYKDVFSSENEAIYQYIPVYNYITKKREAFALLSTGIDGELDNNLTKFDTIYQKNFKDKLKLYNIKMISSFKNSSIIKEKPKFNMLDFYFGNKDLLIMYINCKENYKAVKGYYGLEDLKNAYHRGILKENKVIGLELDTAINIISDTLIVETDSILLHAIIREKEEVKDRSKYKIVGIVERIEPVSKQVKLSNCILF